MKQFLIFAITLIIFSSCSGKISWKTVAFAQQQPEDGDPSMLIDASLANTKKQKNTRKHSSCRHYHKKKYE